MIVDRRRRLELVEDDVPRPRLGEVRLRMLAAGVSFADISMREGIHPEARRPPFTPGWDVVGTVDELGEDVTGVALGDTVAAMPIVGGYADFLCLPATELVEVPRGQDPAEAVSLVLNYVTAYQMLWRKARAKPGETALIHGAAGGVGTALLQLAGLSNIQAFGTASAPKLDTITRLGGSAIDYRQTDFLKVIRQATGQGVDIVFDGIGGWNLVRSWRALRKSGRLVAYGLQSSLAVDKRSGWKLLSSAAGWATAGGLSLLPRARRLLIYSIQRMKRRRPDWFRQDLTSLFGLLAQGKLKPVIDRRLPLEQAALAHELLAKGETVGKIVLVGR